MIEALMVQTLVLVRTTSDVRDEIGGATSGTDDRTTVRGYLEPMTGGSDRREDLVNRNTQIGDWIAFLPAGTDVDGWDRVEYENHVFDVMGPPAPFFDPLTNSEHHIELMLVEVR